MKRREFLKGAALATWAAIWCVPIPTDILEDTTLPIEDSDEESDEELIVNSPTSPYWLVNDWTFEDYIENSHPTRPA